MPVDYSTVTEVPGDKASHEQLVRVFHRYRFAVDYCEDKDVLEVACGAGQALGYLARKARRVVGGDCTEKLVTSAKQYYKDRVELYLLDAHQLPFRDSSFDVGKEIIAPVLHKKKINRVDYVVLSHPHMDHMGGLPYIIENFKDVVLNINFNRWILIYFSLF